MRGGGVGKITGGLRCFGKIFRGGLSHIEKPFEGGVV